MERFFVYSRDHSRPIRLLVLPGDGGKMKYINAVCVSWDGEELRYIRRSVRDRKLYAIPRDQILSAAYARGDDGETMQYERQKQDENTESDPRGGSGEGPGDLER